jgi:hypothetical protein
MHEQSASSGTKAASFEHATHSREASTPAFLHLVQVVVDQDAFLLRNPQSTKASFFDRLDDSGRSLENLFGAYGKPVNYLLKDAVVC